MRNSWHQRNETTDVNLLYQIANFSKEIKDQHPSKSAQGMRPKKLMNR